MDEHIGSLARFLRHAELSSLQAAENGVDDIAFGKVVENDRRQRLKLVLTNDASSTLVQLIFAMALAALILIAMQPQILLSMSAGEFVSFVTAAGFISRPILQLTQVNAVIQQGVAAADSIFNVLDLPKETDEGSVKPGSVRGDIQFSNVRFRYRDEVESDARWVIDGVDFTIPAGSTCALVGRSGSGGADHGCFSGGYRARRTVFAAFCRVA